MLSTCTISTQRGSLLLTAKLCINSGSIEIEARPIPFFDTRDRSHLRFGSLQYRSGLVLTSKFHGFGGLSGLRLDPKGEHFIAISDKGMWFTGKIVYRGDAMTGLADVEAAPMLGADGRPMAARGWFDTESIALDGALVLGLINAMRHEEALADIVRGRLLTDKAAAIVAAVELAVTRGELPAQVDAAPAAEVTSAVVLSRVLVTGQPFGDAEAARFVDSVIMPILIGSATGGSITD